MTVNKVGRPSKAKERGAQILRAARSVVAADGFANTTLSRVAAAAGVQRTLVLHYFGSRDGLMQAFITDAVAEYGDTLLRLGADAPIEDRVARMFEPGAYAQRDDLVVWCELVALAAREPVVRQRLTELWNERWLPGLEHQLSTAYPAAPPEQVAATAYALACLFEAHWAFHLQGVDRAEHAKAGAHTLLTALANS
ncbi:TetR/AcrR family transcriptional regulator [Nocardia asteroides]|uniref:TetR/AcrR family transcriptional regulator n=1 Tax=Nocardia asteroides TaxID=1824 RepID=UPI001E49F41E|nr:TetR/AcrR family transcriptional regulator [Nocardia asteroides]UGT53056.1 TetR/AcrR family transcriptional regulator [Nocardia asteroides]